MAVAIVFFTFLTFYVCAVPIKIAIHFRIEEKARASVGAAIFESRFADRAAIRRSQREKKPSRLLRLIKNKLSLRLATACFAALKYLCKHIQIEKISATGRISTSDAAHTALFSGCANALSGALRQNRRVAIRLRPDFSADHADVSLRGMISIHIGHIIGAAIIGIAHYIKGGFAQWKSTRSKAS